MNLETNHSIRDFSGVIAAWRLLHGKTRIGVIHSKAEYDVMTQLLNVLVDEVGDDSKHELSGLLDVVSALIENYEADNVRLPNAEPKEVLRVLMAQHELKQSDLKAELGSQGVVSEILSGKRGINARQAKALAGRFNVSPSSFL